VLTERGGLLNMRGARDRAYGRAPSH
jgi:hypothetical protein